MSYALPLGGNCRNDNFSCFGRRRPVYVLRLLLARSNSSVQAKNLDFWKTCLYSTPYHAGLSWPFPVLSRHLVSWSYSICSNSDLLSVVRALRVSLTLTKPSAMSMNSRNVVGVHLANSTMNAFLGHTPPRSTASVIFSRLDRRQTCTPC